MKVELSQAEVNIAISALRALRTQQAAAAALLENLLPDGQIRDGMRMVTDLETKLVALKKETL